MFKVGEGIGGERRRAEYSAAVSRLADSVFSCSECATRGRQKNGVKEQNVACMQPCVQHFCANEFLLPFGKRLKHPASEENSTTVVNHQADTSLIL